MTEELKDFVLQNIDPQLTKENLKIEKLFGQASSRQYFRVTITKSQSHKVAKSYVIMKLPQGFSSPAEEITKIAKDSPKELPFINIQHYLNKLEILVPQIYAQDAQLGLLLLEDLNDKSFEKLIEKADSNFKVLYYKKAIDVLIDLQIKTLNNTSKDCIAYHRKFDEDLLNWEFVHFLEYGIENRMQIKVEPHEADLFKNITEQITKLITHMPQGFVHRDFQSRNIMFHNFNFYLIDFQDALLGPLLYDLVALLRDSYITITPQECQTLLHYYADKLPDDHPYFGNFEQLMTDFYLITLQRKLKDTGRFQYIKTVRGNPNFLVSVPQSLEYIKNAFVELAESPSRKVAKLNLIDLKKLISKYLGELQ